MLRFMRGAVVVASNEEEEEGNRRKCPLKVPLQFGRERSTMVVIGHRGASYNLPEHTLAGYRLALELGADYIEPDLVPTKDGFLVACHSYDLNITTNVRDVFPQRHRQTTGYTNNNDNDTYTGYMVQDFTLEEIQQLRVKQRVEDTVARSRYFDGLFPMPTFAEILDLLVEWNTVVHPSIFGTPLPKTFGRAGLYVELKSPSYYAQEFDGGNMGDLLLHELTRHETALQMFFKDSHCQSTREERYDEYQVPPLVIQCFEKETLLHLHQVFTDNDNGTIRQQFGGTILPPPMVYLVSKKHCHEESFWFDIADLPIAGIGPDKACLLASQEEGMDFMDMALEHDLAVHPWTERLESEFVLYDAGGDGSSTTVTGAQEELRYMYCKLGIQGIFAENVDLAVRVASFDCNDYLDPSTSPSSNTTTTTTTSACYETDTMKITFLTIAFGTMGLLLGFIGTKYCSWICNTKNDRTKVSSNNNDDDDNDNDLEML